MRTAKVYLVSSLMVMTGALSACTTVDLSQVSLETTPDAVQTEPQKNIVERASVDLTQTFRAKGWSTSGPREKATTATMMLLNGRDSAKKNAAAKQVTYPTAKALLVDVTQANLKIRQTTKAAEVYLSMADDVVSLEGELSALEEALLAAYEARDNFKHAAIAQGLNSQTDRQFTTKFDGMAQSLVGLKTVTDQYGERIRANIAAQATGTRS